MEVSENFFDVVITQNDHPGYVKHFSGRNYMFFALFGYLAGPGGGGGLPRDWYRTYLCSFSSVSSKIEGSETSFFDAVITYSPFTRLFVLGSAEPTSSAMTNFSHQVTNWRVLGFAKPRIPWDGN